MATVTAKKANKTAFAGVKKGTIISETQYYAVEKIVGDAVQLRNDLGEDIVVSKEYVESCLDTADQYTTEEVKNRTEITQIFLSNPNTAMTVNFNKQVKAEDVVKEIQDTYLNTAPAKIEGELKKTVKKALTGIERTMVGRHHGYQDEFGRIGFIDMELQKDTSKDYDTRSRQVDPRTINWLIVKGVKYRVK